MSDPIVQTTEGAVRGTLEGTAARFLSLPYAAAPARADRFAPPAQPRPWTNVRDATSPGPTAPQPRRDAFGELDMSPYFGPGWVKGEEYLTVDIWAPREARRSPVLVFVHGGGFVAGSSRAPLHDGAAFARDGVVVVTLNYRLGVAGFLDLPGAPRNRGLLDVLAALRWVQRNIAGFGGDPGNVTLAGQSAGATMVGGLLADPRATGLFHRAILQSGSGLGAFSPEQAARVARAAAGVLGVAPDADGFAAVPDEDLVAAVPRIAGIDLHTADRTDPLMGLSPFSLVLDRQPAESRLADVGLLIGTTAEEGNLYLAPQGELAASTAEDVHATAARAHRDPDRLVAAYQAQRPGAGPGELRSAILGDALFGVGTRRLAEAHGGAHVYEFAWRSTALDGRLGAAHALELPFVFDRLTASGLHGPKALTGPDGGPEALAEEMHSAWIAFARTGDPGWPRFGAGGRIRRFGSVSETTEARDLPAW
ncbi:carboxylesterase/lipase family protein [Nocardiopsis suaedae]|uniref:Carboxylic ester hydrolase n=1 Tax=Nocardiopsis suaedae TaxID=3018444 RepID=A0ABT4TP64_9ACTN|nr:carboxylesterase family protein [Nocardiopsis suaedae]MDA2806468.1 carboxylesterase family protein [Nocardiopsis suaedae]